MNERFEDNPRGWSKRWEEEMKASDEALEQWHKSAEKCLDAYTDEKDREGMRINLFASSVNTREAMLYGKVPTVDVSRSFNDAEDDDGRIAADVLQRHLNRDIERPEDAFRKALGLALNDWLRVGFGNLRWRYVRETEAVDEVAAQKDEQGNELAPAVPATEKVTREDVECDYKYWKDQRWSPARVFPDVRWWAFRNTLSQESCEKSFGERLPMEMAAGGTPRDDDKEPTAPWARAVVWDIWDKEHKCVWFWCKGVDHVLKMKGVKLNSNGSLPDPLGLKGFWPFPEPLFSNLTTSKLVPRADYALAQDIYKSVNDSSERIDALKNIIQASGVYDQSVGELGQLLKDNKNKLVPAQNYAALAEKGGIAQCIAWLALEPIIAAIDKLRELRTEEIGLLFQATGDSDIMRGQAMAPGTTATEQAIKAKFASVRMQRAQDEFARFASDAQRIRGEIICKQFSEQTIAERANVNALPQQDQMRVGQAIQILKSPQAGFRIVVKAEAISLTDYAANKQESMDVLSTIATFVQATMGMPPQALPTLIRILQVFLARVKGGDAIEGILDEAIAQAQQVAAQPPQPPPPDPKLQTAQVKAGAEQFKAQADVQSTALDMKAKMASHAMDMQKLEAQQRSEAMKVLTRQPMPGQPVVPEAPQ